MIITLLSVCIFLPSFKECSALFWQADGEIKTFLDKIFSKQTELVVQLDLWRLVLHLWWGGSNADFTVGLAEAHYQGVALWFPSGCPEWSMRTLHSD